ncbi:DNA-directed DNA polymerase eta rad30, partial [Coelomomyces lativittatus]
LDCFYCQVEHKRLGIPASVPLAVQQWQGLIAVNYAARAANVKRHESIHEALKKCPELRLVHVATYSDVDVNPDYHPDPSPLTHKVSLEPYRRASADIFKIISRFSPKYQKASVDEGYLDLTQEIIKSILDSPPKNITFDDWEGTFVIGDNANQTWANYALYLASKKIRQIRECIFGELSFTCSAGIFYFNFFFQFKKLCIGFI